MRYVGSTVCVFWCAYYFHAVGKNGIGGGIKRGAVLARCSVNIDGWRMLT